MKQTIRFSLALLAFFMAGCSSAPVKDNYYSLSLGSYEVPVARSGANDEVRLTLVTVQLPQFLRQPGLVIQVGEHSIESARHHLWGERLDDGIAKVLIKDLMAQSDTLLVERSSGRWTSNNDCSLRIEFDRFHATDSSLAVTSGRYWLYRDTDGEPIISEFDYSESLRTDGYQHAVERLRSSLTYVAKSIVTSIEDNAICE